MASAISGFESFDAWALNEDDSLRWLPQQEVVSVLPFEHESLARHYTNTTNAEPRSDGVRGNNLLVRKPGIPLASAHTESGLNITDSVLLPQSSWHTETIEFSPLGYDESFHVHSTNGISNVAEKSQCGSSDSLTASPTTGFEKRRKKEQEKQERRRAQNRAAQRNFRERRQQSLKASSTRLSSLEAKIVALSSDNDGLSEIITTLRRQVRQADKEKQGLRFQGVEDGTDGDLIANKLDSSGDDAMSIDETPISESLRWHWLRVQKELRSQQKHDPLLLPSKFI